jgi:type VII secretion protein EccB
MATKNDLIEAQNFSRRRLLTAFVSGAPGGRELEPAKPLRAVIIGVALTAAVILAGVFYGLVQPGLPNGWQNNRLVIAKDTGARYVTSNGVLHPVINIVSARLLIPSGDYSVITTSEHSLAGVKLGSGVGIVGAPDTLPAPDRLVDDGWTACVADDGGTAVRIGGGTATATGQAVVVSTGGVDYVVAGQRSYQVDADQTDAVLRAAGVASLDPTPVTAAWLDLFTPGTPLAPLTVTDAGGAVSGTALHIGDVVHISGSADDQRYLVQADGTLGSLSSLAYQLLQLGSGRGSNRVIEVSPSQVSTLPTAAKGVGGSDWPASGFPTIAATTRPCAVLQHDPKGQPRTVLGTESRSADTTAAVTVPAGRGAIVRAGGRGAQGTTMLTLVDATGTAYALPGADQETVKRLGYTDAEVGRVDQGWIRLLPAGPALSTQAAGRNPDAPTS